MVDDSERALAEVLSGNVVQLSALPAAIAGAAQPSRIVTRSAIARAIEGWRAQARSTEALQAWASFVRRGYVAGTQPGPVQPIDIAYEAHHEDLLATVIGRLDELRDAIDGEITAAEADELLAALRG
jgi:hypothetical protein